MRRRKGHDEHHGNTDRWLLTYADMITLLLAFFVMMYSMSVLNLSKFHEAAFSIRSGFGGKAPGRGTMGANGEFGAQPTPVQGDTAGVSWQVLGPLVKHIGNIAKDSSVQIGEDNRGIVITLCSDQLMFKPGSSEIEAGAYPILNRVAGTLHKIDNLIQIEGHTCDLAPRDSKYASNWELSAARATNVLRYLAEQCNLPADRFAAAGYGSVRPVAPNKTEAGRHANRRVEIVILRPEAPVGSKPKYDVRSISDPAMPVIQRRTEQ